MQHLPKTFLLIIIFHFNCYVYSQPLLKQKSEQIKSELKTNLDDTTRVLKLQTLSLYYVSKAGEEKADIDSSYIFARQAELLSRKVNYNRGKWMSLILYSKIFQEGDNSSKGIRELKKAFAIAQKNNILWLQGEAYRELTNYYEFNKAECLIRIKIIEKAYKSFKKGGSKQQIADILVYYGAHYHYSGNFKAALQKFNEAKDLYEAIGNKDQMQNLYHYMARTYSKLGLYTEAVKYGLQSIKMGERNNDIFSLTVNYMNLALCYYRLENYELALNYHKKVFNYSLEMHAPEISPFYNASYIIKDLIRLGRKKEAKQFFFTTVTNLKVNNYYDNIWLQICYMTVFDDIKNSITSHQACDKLIELQKTNRNIISEAINIEINNNITAHLFKTKNYQLAAEYLNKSIKLGKSIKDIDMIINGHIMKFKLDSASGNYISAISHLRKYEKTKDSIFNDVKFYQISNLQIKYETEKKDKNIHVLTNESQLQKIKIHNDEIIKIVAGLIVILLLIITVLIFRSYKNKKESNEKLQASKLDIEKKNKVLKNVVKEKEWLLKELHHRVKNNLQVVISLLNTQSSYLKDKSAVDAIKNSQNRIYSMSLIHQRLYQADGLSCVKISEYIKELVNYLKDSYQSNATYILDIEDIEMHVSQAVPIGLILNEAITNALKYAFPDQEKGTIKVSLRHFKDDYFTLEIMDNGIGIEEEIDITKYNSLGMKLMEGLSSDLNGEFKVTPSNGVKISVVFLYDYSFAIKMKS